MTAHTLLAIALLALILCVGLLVRTLIRRRAAGLVGETTEHALGLPTVLYFTSEHCPPCRFQQEPALAELRTRLGATFGLRTIAVEDDPDTARRYRVLSAPTTIVLDERGIIRNVNVGVATAGVLHRQLAAEIHRT